MEVHFKLRLNRAWPNSLPKVAARQLTFWKMPSQRILAEVTEVSEMLDSRYDDIKSGRVRPIDGEAFFDSLRAREEGLLKKHPQK